MTDRAAASSNPAEAAPVPLSVVTSVLKVRRATDAVLVIEGSRGAPAWPWFRTILPAGLGVLACIAALLAGVGDASWLALVVPATVGIALIQRRRPSVVTLFRGSRFAQWQRGAVQFTLSWRKAELADDRLAVVLKLSGGEVRLPLRREATSASRSQAAAFIEAFAKGDGSFSGTTGRAVDDAFFEEFGLIEASRDRVVALATESLGLRVTLALTAWLVSTGGAIALASVGRAAPLVALALALAPACVWLVPVRRLAFAPRRGLGVDGDEPSAFDVELTQTRDDGVPVYIDVRRGSRLLRFVQRAQRIHGSSEDILRVARRDVEGLNACASFIQTFAQSPEEVPAHSDASAAEQLLGWHQAEPLTLACKMRLRSWPFERSSAAFIMTALATLPVVITTFGLLISAIGIGTIVVALLGRSIVAWVRPRLIFERGARALTWRLRGLEVRLRWTSIESARTGKGLVIQTEAGPLRVPLRRRTDERQIRAATEALERHFPPDQTTAPPSATWPAGFTAALDCIDFKAVTPIRLQFLCGRLSPVIFLSLVMAETALACGMWAIAVPPTAVLISLIALISWPFLFAVREVTIDRGTRSLTVHRWRSQDVEKLTPPKLLVGTIGDTMTAESFIIVIPAMDHKLILFPLATEERAVEEARRALLTFSGFDASEGDK